MGCAAAPVRGAAPRGGVSVRARALRLRAVHPGQPAPTRHRQGLPLRKLVIQAPALANISSAIEFIYQKAFNCSKARKKSKIVNTEPKDNDKMWKGHGGYGRKMRNQKVLAAK